MGVERAEPGAAVTGSSSIGHAQSVTPAASGSRRLAGALALGLVVVAFCLPLFVGLGRTDLQGDEAIYSFATDVMVASGDWITPRSSPREDAPFFEKPPLKFWIVAAPIRLGLLPDNEFGLRFWDAVFGSAAFLYVFAMGRRIGGSIAGLAAVLMLFVQRPLVFDHGLRSNNMEAALVLAYCGGMYHAWQWRTAQHDWRGRAHVFAFALYFVLGFMTKFVAALFLPTIVAVALLARRDDRARLIGWWRTWLGAAGLTVLLTAPWFVYQYLRVGERFLQDVFGAAVYTRLTHFLDPSHLQPWYFYFTTLWTDLGASQTMVWAVAGMILVVWRTARTGWPEGLMVLLWFVLPVAIISMGTSKIYHYLYPFLPPVALAAGYAVAVAWRALMSLMVRLDGWMDALLGATGRRIVGSPAMRGLLVFVAALGAVTAVWALVFGNVKVAIGGVVLLRASTPFRALPFVVVPLLLARRTGALRAAVVSLVVASVLPIAAYRSEVPLLSFEHHRLGSIRDCLKRVLIEHPVPGDRPPVYVDWTNVSHQGAFYLRTVGKWTLEDASDASVFSALFVRPRPVVLGDARYREFDAWLVDRKAAGAPPNDTIPGGVAPINRLSDLATVPLMDELLILPGPYGVCALEQARSRSR